MIKISLNGDDWKCKDYLGEDWIWRDGEKRDTKDWAHWSNALVPGCALYDMYRCGKIPDPHFERNSLYAEWIPQRTWIYRKEFEIPEIPKDSNVHICFEGIDYDAKIFFNDCFLGEHHSMFTPVSFDVTHLLERKGKNLLAVVLEPAPAEQPQVSKTRYVKTHKSRMTYWWDFCPRMIHVGIWDDVYLTVTRKARMLQTDIEVSLKDTLTRADLVVSAPVSCADGAEKAELMLKAEVFIGDDMVTARVLKGEKQFLKFTLSIEHPQLWWPNGYGEQPMYRLQLTLLTDGCVTDRKKISFGIRDVLFLANSTPDESARPYRMCVNGRTVFMKGYNWVPIDAMYGVERREKRERLIRLLKEAQVNIVRIWGGGLIEKEAFYDLCDQNGIFIWQEFIQSSSGIENKPSEESAFLAFMQDEAKQIIPRRKHHPSLAIWGGGNELSGENNEMISMKEPVIRVLAEQAKKLDPTRYFLESSPTGRVFLNTLENIERDPTGLHDVHGPWEYLGSEKQYELYNSGTSLLSSEFGVEGMANLDVLTKLILPEHVWPPDSSNEYYFHRGFWWNNFPMVQKCFGGEIKDIEQAVRASQMLQYEGLRYAVEANRRRYPTCSGTFPWQFNEPFPNNTCTCVVDYYAMPKPAYYGVKSAYRRQTVTAAFAGQSLGKKELFETDIFWQSADGKLPLAVCAEILETDGTIVLECVMDPLSGSVQCGNWETSEEVINTTEQERREKAIWMGKLRLPVKKIRSAIFLLKIVGKCEGNAQIENTYLFSRETLAELLNLEPTELQVRKCDGCNEVTLHVENSGHRILTGLWLEELVPTGENSILFFSDNYLTLIPGEIREIHITFGEIGKKRKIRISGYNIFPIEIQV